MAKPIQETPQISQETPKIAQDAPQERPRSAHEGPRDAQEHPKAGQEPPKMAPDPSKIEPREPEDQFLRRSLWEALFERLLVRFFIVFLLARKTRDI